MKVHYSIAASTNGATIFPTTFPTFGAALEAIYNDAFTYLLACPRETAPFVTINIEPMTPRQRWTVDVDTENTSELYIIEEHPDEHADSRSESVVPDAQTPIQHS